MQVRHLHWRWALSKKAAGPAAASRMGPAEQRRGEGLSGVGLRRAGAEERRCGVPDEAAGGGRQCRTGRRGGSDAPAGARGPPPLCCWLQPACLQLGSRLYSVIPVRNVRLAGSLADASSVMIHIPRQRPSLHHSRAGHMSARRYSLAEVTCNNGIAAPPPPPPALKSVFHCFKRS